MEAIGSPLGVLLFHISSTKFNQHTENLIQLAAILITFQVAYHCSTVCYRYNYAHFLGVIGIVSYVTSIMLSITLCYELGSWFLLIFLITPFYFLGALQFAPFLCLELQGTGILLNFAIHGILFIEICSYVLNESLTFYGILEILPIHLLWQSWKVVKDMPYIKNDYENKIWTSAALMGKYDSFRFVVILHFFAYAFIAVDVLMLDYVRAICLLGVVFSLILIYNLRNMEFDWTYHLSAIIYWSSTALLCLSNYLIESKNSSI